MSDATGEQKGGVGLTVRIKSCLKQEQGCNCTVRQPYSAASPPGHRTKRPAASSWLFRCITDLVPHLHLLASWVSLFLVQSRFLQVLFLSVEKVHDVTLSLFKKKKGLTFPKEHACLSLVLLLFCKYQKSRCKESKQKLTKGNRINKNYSFILLDYIAGIFFLHAILLFKLLVD